MGIDNIHLWMIKCSYQQIMTLKKFLQEFDMKRRTVLGKGIGIIALAALIGFLATACPEEDGGKKDNNGNNDNGDNGGASAFLVWGSMENGTCTSTPAALVSLYPVKN